MYLRSSGNIQNFIPIQAVFLRFKAPNFGAYEDLKNFRIKILHNLVKQNRTGSKFFCDFLACVAINLAIVVFILNIIFVQFDCICFPFEKQTKLNKFTI